LGKPQNHSGYDGKEKGPAVIQDRSTPSYYISYNICDVSPPE